MVLCPVPDHPATACMIWRQTRPGQSTYLGHVTHASGVQGTIMTCGYRITTRVKYGWRAGGHMPWWCLIRKTVTIAAWMYLFMDNKNMIKKKKKYPQINVTGPYWWEVNIGSGNGLVSSGNKPLPEPFMSPYDVIRPQWVKRAILER